MNKKPVLFATILLPALGVGLFAQSCSSGESVGTTGSGGSTVSTGGSTGTGGSTSTTGTGGRTGTGGATTTGTGGTTALGTGGTTVSGTGGGTVTGMDNASVMNGYLDNGTWHGAAYTSANGSGVTIAPVCDALGTSACFKTAGKQLCANGTVGADITTTSSALLAFSVNQLSGAAKLGIATGGTGIAVKVTGYIPGMRVQVQDLSQTMRWCANLLTDTAMIPWGMFNTACWSPSTGTFLPSGAMIADVGIVIPSLSSAPVPFNFCLVDAHQY